MLNGTYFLAGKTSFPVPLKLVFFNALLNNKKVISSWVTQNETNTRNFEVERSRDGYVFYFTGNVHAANRTATNSYSFIDNAPLPGVSYYRLKMIDNDGRFGYSRIVAVDNKGDRSLIVSPNPVKNKLQVSFSVINSGVLKIINAEGREMMNRVLTAGETQTFINTSLLPVGVYNLIMVTDQGSSSVKFVKL